MHTLSKGDDIMSLKGDILLCIVLVYGVIDIFESHLSRWFVVTIQTWLHAIPWAWRAA